MVPSLDGKVSSGSINQRTSAFTKCIPPQERPAKLFRLEAHNDTPPVAFASSLTKKPAFIEQSESTIMTKHGAGIRYRGTEYITSISTPASTTVARGQCLYCLPVSPQFIASTRLQLAAQMYTRYIFKSIKFYYSGTAPTTQAGSLMMFGDYDPSQNPGQAPGDATLRYSYTHNAAEFSVWQQAVCEINDKVYEDMLYCDPDAEPRWSTQGCFWLLSSGNISPANLELGKLIIEYEIDFAVPDFRGTIPFAPSQQLTLTMAATSASSAMVFSGYAGSRGAFIMRVDNAPTVNIAFNVSLNAYNQGAPAITLQQGQIFFCATTSTGNLIPLWTPDLYALDSLTNNACVVNTTTASSSSFSATLFPIQSVTND